MSSFLRTLSLSKLGGLAELRRLLQWIRLDLTELKSSFSQLWIAAQIVQDQLPYSVLTAAAATPRTVARTGSDGTPPYPSSKE